MTLQNCENYAIKQSQFYRKLKQRDNYLNGFFRVKDEMLKRGIIDYRLDGDFDKEIYLTEKGQQILERVNEIEDLLRSANLQ